MKQKDAAPPEEGTLEHIVTGLREAGDVSMVSIEHLEWIQEIVKEINENHIDGALVECGVWRGGSVMCMMSAQKQYSQERDIYLYDTFSGMVSPSSRDSSKDLKKFNNKAFDESCPAASLDLVKSNVSKVGYNENRTHYIVGDVCETLRSAEDLPEKIALLRLDTDFYDSTRMELDVLFPKLSIGGYLIIDDYWAFIGCKKATDEFIKLNSNKLERITPRKSRRKWRKKYRLAYKRSS
tara:strand:- start:556 stop:1269 length:714 start_codon:yes stop_codon:yes gene_type:complete